MPDPGALRSDPAVMTIGEMLERRARISPERIFWEDGRRRWRYGELDVQADRIAAGLRADGLKPGDHAAIFAGNDFSYLCAHFGAAKAGVVLAHLNARYTAAELAALGNHCDAKLLFFAARQSPVVEKARSSLSRVRRFVVLPGDEGTVPSGGWFSSWEAWLSPPSGGEGGLSASSIDPDAPFQLLYTSGTTGDPKGVLISHRAKLRQGITHALNLGLQPGDRVLSSLPLYHQFAQWLLLVSVPLTGATVVARAGFDPAESWKDLEGAEITHFPAVPTMLYRMLSLPGEDRGCAPRLRCIVYGGAPMDPARIAGLRAAFPGVRLFQGFGQTETGYCLGLMDGEHRHRPDSLGRPDLFSEVRLLDAEGRDVPQGEVGEIVARTPYLMNGYYKDAVNTAAYFAYGGDWGRTGDLAWKDEEGYFFLAGRLDEKVVSGGVNLYPAEVERVLLAHPGVSDAAVLGLPDPDWGETLAAVIVPEEGASPSAAELQDHCRASLAGFKIPRRFFVLPAFPLTPSGKVKKAALRAWIEEGDAAPL